MPKTKPMPVLFVGHGSPMNAIEDNEFTQTWIRIAAKLPTPKAILAVSAHWFVKGSRVSTADAPETIYDMYGFPDELYRLTYPCPGSAELAGRARGLVSAKVDIDNGWGIDHGTWSVLHRMYPKADIPVVQFAVDRDAEAEAHFRIGRELRALRDEGILIVASGNIVHNLAQADFKTAGGYAWAEKFDAYIKKHILEKTTHEVIACGKAGESARLAVPIPDHFFPLLYALGAMEEDDAIEVFNEACVYGALSMTGYLFGG